MNIVVGQWREAGRVVGQDLCGRTSHTEQHERAEDLVLDDAGEEFGPPGSERLDDHSGQEPGEPRLEVPERCAHLGVTLEIEVDRVLFGLVEQAGPVRLQDDTAVRTSKPFGGDDGVVLGLGPGPVALGYAVAGEQLGAGARVQPAAVGVGGEESSGNRPGAFGVDVR